jgi:hypothetical protein
LVATCISQLKPIEKPTTEQVKSINPLKLNVNNDISIYPNPSSKELTIEGTKELHPSALNIYNIDGKELYSHAIDKTRQTTLTIPVEKLQNGIYFIKLNTPSHTESKSL